MACEKINKQFYVDIIDAPPIETYDDDRYEEDLNRVIDEYWDLYGYEPPITFYDFTAGRVLLLKIVVAKQFPYITKVYKYIQNVIEGNQKVIQFVEEIKNFAELTPEEQLLAAKQDLGDDATQNQLREWVNRLNGNSPNTDDVNPEKDIKSVEEEPEIEIVEEEPEIGIVEEEPEIEIVEEEPEIEIVEGDINVDFDVGNIIQDGDMIRFQESIENGLDLLGADAGDEEIRELYSNAFEEAFGSEIGDTILLSIDDLILSSFSTFFDVLLIVGVLLIGYMIGKRLFDSWKDGGIFLPMYVPMWLFNAKNSDIEDIRLDDFSIKDEISQLFDRHEMKKNPRKYISKKLNEFLQNNSSA